MPHPLPLPVHLRQRLFRTRLSHAIHIRLAKAEQNPGIPRFYTHGDNLSQSFNEAVEEEARRIIAERKEGQDFKREGAYIDHEATAIHRSSALPVA